MLRLPLFVALSACVLAGCPARSGFDPAFDDLGGELTGDTRGDGDRDIADGAGDGSVPGDDGDAADDGPIFVAPRFLMQYDRSWVILARDQVMKPLVPEAAMPAIYSVTPALPAGLTLDAANGTISGTPSALVTPFTTYEISAISDAFAARATLNLAVVDALVVDTNADLPAGGTLGDGICGQPGECSIRAAVAEANALAGVQVILVPGGSYVMGALVLRSDAIVGRWTGNIPTVITPTGAMTSLFTVGSTDTTYLTDVDVSTSTTSSGNGGCFNSSGKLNLSHVQIHDCGAQSGGAIDINGTGELTLEQSSLADNNAAVSGGAVSVRNVAKATITTSIFTDNTAILGAAVAVNGTATLARSYFGDNVAQNGGGAAYVFSSAELAVVNGTFEGNRSNGSTGGALLSFGRLDVAYSTFSGNVASSAGSVVSVQGGIANMRGILMFGQNTPCDTDHQRFTSQGFNVLDLAASTCPDLAATTDKTNANLGTFDGTAAANGGPTPTIRIDANGAAHDTGDLDCPATDQRGEPRPQSTTGAPSCDAGAFELGLETS